MRVNLILFEDLHDVVLTGHSYGGMVITDVTDRRLEGHVQLLFAIQPLFKSHLCRVSVAAA